MKELPLHERPRERLLLYGEDNLSNLELLAIILGQGTQKFPVKKVAELLMETFGNLRSLFQASVEDLMKIPGIGKVKAIELKAVFTLTRRFSSYLEGKRECCRSLNQAVALFQEIFVHPEKESAGILLLDAKGYLISRKLFSVGSLTQVIIHPRELLAEVIKKGAHGFFLAHNHPSGDPTPSKEDLSLTKKIYEASQVLEILCHDHLILGNQSYYSMKRNACFSIT